MMTRAELAFSALDRDNKGFITQKDFRKLTKKLSDQELNDLMSKVLKGLNKIAEIFDFDFHPTNLFQSLSKEKSTKSTYS